jgi:hypothetical protein
MTQTQPLATGHGGAGLPNYAALKATGPSAHLARGSSAYTVVVRDLNDGGVLGAVDAVELVHLTQTATGQRGRLAQGRSLGPSESNARQSSRAGSRGCIS